MVPNKWAQVQKIMRGIASDLDHIHTRATAAIIHGDLKPDNILLGQLNGLVPKRGLSFKLSRLLSQASKGGHDKIKEKVTLSRKHGCRYEYEYECGYADTAKP
ncbi:hypothetical protein HYC85_020663 [Camellia sinensis]|uniref:Protein kinase domain-containing protein n=1 Tax=Camellia sinensis TaxID=4442 RepID=A0A7J7GSX4_CAMSI|nr:hypothetical protein HYC85_020663 [Camellia sinensis]